MCLVCSVTYVAAGVALFATSGAATLATATQATSKVSSGLTSLQALPGVIRGIKAPTLQEPGWLKQQKAAEVEAARQVSQATVVTYSVTTRGVITANIAEFRSQANATLNDQRGWAHMGVTFQEVTSGGMFTLVLSEASQVPTFSPGCDSEYSCRAGRYVVINQDRWIGATPSWSQSGGSLRDYRHLVVNHETGHWLGHDHEPCGGVGQAAPVMQQQSVNLQGCNFNPWPLASELWSTQLGIRKA